MGHDADRRALLVRIAKLFSEELKETQEAVQAWREVLALDKDDREALAQNTSEAERAAIEARRAANEFRRATSSTTSPYREVGISSVTSRRDPAIESPISETRYAIPSSGEDLRHTLERLQRDGEVEE